MDLEEAKANIGKQFNYINKSGEMIYSNMTLRSVKHTGRSGLANISYEPNDNSVFTVGVEGLELSEQGMNLEEAKANIGKEVVHIKTNENYIIDSIGSRSLVFVKKKSREQTYYVDPHLLKLKDKPMQNYKIKVTPETSAEVQELFFELGCEWRFNGRDIMEYIKDLPNIFLLDGCLYNYVSHDSRSKLEEITLPQLRDLVVLKRNDVGDATYVGRSGSQYYRGYRDYLWNGVHWLVTVVNDDAVTPIKKESEIKVKQLNKFVHLKSTEMTWQDALRYLENGEDVEFYNQTTNIWHNLLDSTIRSMRSSNGKFRLKPKTIHIDGGDYTKEELLKIVGEMG